MKNVEYFTGNYNGISLVNINEKEKKAVTDLKRGIQRVKKHTDCLNLGSLESRG